MIRLTLAVIAFGFVLNEAATASASMVSSNLDGQIDASGDEHHCGCGPRCRQRTCCCQPAEAQPSALELRGVAHSPKGPVSWDERPCLGTLPCRDSSQPSVPSLLQITKSTAADTRASWGVDEEWVALLTADPGDAPAGSVRNLDRPPRVRPA